MQKLTANSWYATHNKRSYFNSLGSLAYIENGHGIPLNEFVNHYVMVFDLTSTQEASHDFLHPELTNASISLELKFGTALRNNIEIFLLGEKASTIYINSDRNVSKIPCCRQQMNEKQLSDHVSRFKHPKNKFFWCFCS